MEVTADYVVSNALHSVTLFPYYVIMLTVYVGRLRVSYYIGIISYYQLLQLKIQFSYLISG